MIRRGDLRLSYGPDGQLAQATRGARTWSYVHDEEGEVRRIGLAYGTLADHAEKGEERFLVEWRRSDDSVWYDILAFSRPRHFLSRLCYRRVRAMQQRFGQQSAAAMQRAA